MQLWLAWWPLIRPLREACSRQSSFLWLALASAGFCSRSDLLGVSSIVRALGLASHCYDRLLGFFHSTAVDPDALARVWTREALARLPVHRQNGRPVFLADGIKIPKSGRYMPAVKSLHQDSESNTKPTYIMGHSIQVISLLAAADNSFFAVPLIGRIQEGVKFTNRDHRSLPRKLVNLLDAIDPGEPCVLVADAAFANQTLARPLLARDHHLVSRLPRSTVAYTPALTDGSPRKRGRPRRYGEKIKLWTLFDDASLPWQSADSPIYDEHGITLRFLCLDLLWRPLGRLLRFVLVDHPTRGRSIFMTTDSNLSPLAVIRLYGLRFKIELSFKQAVRSVGVYAYHFWMMGMRKLTRGAGTQYLHCASERYRNGVHRKMAAYHRHIQVGLISQGILQAIAITQPRAVWASFGSWLRTVRPGVPPSELVVSIAMRNTLPEFLALPSDGDIFKKFLHDHIDPDKYSPLRLAG
jgi:DDE superfamily endonuclease